MFAWLVFSPTASGQPASRDSLLVVARADRERIRVGDPLIYVVAAVIPPGGVIAWPSQGNELGSFEILGLTRKGPVSGPDGTSADTLVYTLTGYTPGAQAIPPFTVACNLPNGAMLSATADSIPIAIISVIEDEAADIRDLKSPVEVPADTPWYVWAAIAAAAAIIALTAIYFYRRRQPRQPSETPTVAVARSPYEIALEEFDRLDNAQLLAQGSVKQHYTAVSDILRRYIGGRYGVMAMEVTTRELLAELDERQIRFESRHDIARLLEVCDLVKFAKYIPDEEQQTHSIDDGRAIVEATKPEAPPPAVSEAPPAEQTVTEA